ncbi:MAG: hypothetical protein ACPGGK_13650 [Pikeienuella sp.]
MTDYHARLCIQLRRSHNCIGSQLGRHLSRGPKPPAKPEGDLPKNSLTEFANVMPPRAAAAAPASFTEFSRTDLHEPTIGAYVYEPKIAVGAAVGWHQISTRNGQRYWYSFIPRSLRQLPPVVVLFHGAGRSGLSMIDMWQSTARKHGIVLIAPNSKGQQ